MEQLVSLMRDTQRRLEELRKKDEKKNRPKKEAK